MNSINYNNIIPYYSPLTASGGKKKKATNKRKTNKRKTKKNKSRRLYKN